MIFFSLASTALSSIFYGIIVTAVIMAILYVVLKALSRGIVQTPVFFVTGVVLAILLVIQTSLMIGAMQAKDAADSAEIYVSQLIEDSYGTADVQDNQWVLDAITEEFPIIGNYINLANISEYDVESLASTIHDSMTDYLKRYIWHRVWWIFCFTVVACIITMYFRNNRSGITKTITPRKRSNRTIYKKYNNF